MQTARSEDAYKCSKTITVFTHRQEYDDIHTVQNKCCVTYKAFPGPDYILYEFLEHISLNATPATTGVKT